VNHTSLTANTEYFYQAFSYNITPNYSSGTVILPTTTFALAPTATAASAITTSGFDANWTAPIQGNAPFTYRVDYSIDNTFGSGVTTLSGISSGALSQAISVPSNGTTYYYRVY